MPGAIPFTTSIAPSSRDAITMATSLHNQQLAANGEDPLTIHEFLVLKFDTLIIAPIEKQYEHFQGVTQAVALDPPPDE